MKVGSELGLVGLALVGLAGAADGAMISPQVTVDAPVVGGNQVWTTDWDLGVYVPRFNPALGTLTSVTLGAMTTINSSVLLGNIEFGGKQQASSGTVSTGVNIRFRTSDLSKTLLNLSASSSSGSFSLNYGNTTTLSNLFGAGSGAALFTDPGSLAMFSGSGTLALRADSTTFIQLNYAGGPTVANNTTDAYLVSMVTYTYTPVPEPALLGFVGLAGLALMRKRNA
jgi:hypothetical protein